MTLTVLAPATEQVLAELLRADASDADAPVARARSAHTEVRPVSWAT